MAIRKPSDIGKSLRFRRKQKKISQKTLRGQLGISMKHLSMIENGHVTPSFDLLFKWLKELELEIIFTDRER